MMLSHAPIKIRRKMAVGQLLTGVDVLEALGFSHDCGLVLELTDAAP